MSLRSEINTYKKQIKQHSLTIIELEKEIALLREKELDYKSRIINLEKTIRDSSNLRSQPPPPPPQAQVIIQKSDEQEIVSLHKSIDLLRGECATYKQRLIEQDELIRTLRRDLSGASAKLSDVQGELTEKQKRELERNKQLVIEQQRELSDNRAQMAKLSEIVDKQTKQLEALKCELSKSKLLIEKYRLTSEENGKLAIELREKLADVELQLSKFDNIKKEEVNY
jgi:chromosome segregation ATPase